MARLIEIDTVEGIPGRIVLQVGDILLFKATGGHVRTATDVIELLGAFVTASLADTSSVDLPGTSTTGAILTPMSAPNLVLFRSLAPGQATIDIVTGDPWRLIKTITLEITVERT